MEKKQRPTIEELEQILDSGNKAYIKPGGEVVIVKLGVNKLAEKIDQQYLKWAEKAYEEETGNFFWLSTNEKREEAIRLLLQGEAPIKENQSN